MYRILRLFTVLTIALFTISCNSDETSIEDQLNTVTYKVMANGDSPFTINGFHHTNLTTRHKWERTEQTKDYYASISVNCDDPTVLITIEIYKNGKLIERREANSRLNINVPLK